MSGSVARFSTNLELGDGDVARLEPGKMNGGVGILGKGGEGVQEVGAGVLGVALALEGAGSLEVDPSEVERRDVLELAPGTLEERLGELRMTEALLESTSGGQVRRVGTLREEGCSLGAATRGKEDARAGPRDVVAGSSVGCGRVELAESLVEAVEGGEDMRAGQPNAPIVGIPSRRSWR